MDESFSAYHSLPVTEKSAYHINHNLSIHEIASLDIDPITAISVHTPHAEFALAIKHTQYTAGPYELAIYPKHREIRSIGDLSADEGAELFQTALALGLAFQEVSGRNGPIYIGLNQHIGIDSSPPTIERRSDLIRALVQTVPQLHLHVYCEPVTVAATKSRREVDREQQRELVDPFIPVLSDLLREDLIRRPPDPNIYSGHTVQYGRYPLGLNITLTRGLRTMDDPKFQEAFADLNQRYLILHGIVANLFVDNKTLDAYGAPVPLTKRSRRARVRKFLTAHQELSGYSQRLLMAVANNIQPYNDAVWYNTFVLGPAYSASIYGTEEQAYLNWQPRVISRGNMLSSFGEFRTRRIFAIDRRLTWIYNIFNDAFRHLKLHLPINWQIERNGFLEDNWQSRLDAGIREQAIEYARRELIHYTDQASEEKLLRRYLSGIGIEDPTLTVDQIVDSTGNLIIEDDLRNRARNGESGFRIFDQNIRYIDDGTTQVVSQSDQEVGLRGFMEQRRRDVSEKWGITIDDVDEDISLNTRQIISKSGTVVYSEAVETERITAFGIQLGGLLAGGGIQVQAYFGRAKATASVISLLRTHHKDTHTLTDIDDLVGATIVVDDFTSLEQTMQLLESTYRGRILRKVNLFATPLPQDPLYRGCFYYIQQDDGQILELQILPKVSALLDAAGYPLIFKPNLDLFRKPLAELLEKEPTQVTLDDLSMVARTTYINIVLRLLYDEWRRYTASL